MPRRRRLFLMNTWSHLWTRPSLWAHSKSKHDHTQGCPLPTFSLDSATFQTLCSCVISKKQHVMTLHFSATAGRRRSLQGWELSWGISKIYHLEYSGRDSAGTETVQWTIVSCISITWVSPWTCPFRTLEAVLMHSYGRNEHDHRLWKILFTTLSPRYILNPFSTRAEHSDTKMVFH